MPTNEKQTRMMHIVNLMSIAYADENILEEEKNILIHIAQQLELTEEDFNLCVDYWKKTDENSIPIAVPKSEEDQIEYLKHFAIVLLIDGEITENEKAFLAHVANQFGYDAEKVVPALIEDVYQEYFADDESDEDEEEEDPLFEDTDDELQIDMGKMHLESCNVEGAFDDLFLPSLRNEAAAEYFMIIPSTNTRLFRLSVEQIGKVQEAADKGYALAIYTLGRYYQVVKPIKDSATKARTLLEKAAEAGIADAHWALAIYYLLGYDGPVLFDHYNELIEKAFENGSMQAFKQKLSDSIYGLHGNKCDPKTAISIIEDFFENDEVYASIYPDILDLQGEAYRKIGNKDKADKCYESSRGHGFFESGSHRFENRTEGPDRDFYRQTLSVLLDFSCDDKDPNSFMTRALEDIYHLDKEDCNNPDDYMAKLKEDLENAYVLGNGDAAYLMGHCYYTGSYGFEKNNNEAWEWFIKGVDMESGLAFMGTAQMIADGIHPDGLPDDYMEVCQLWALRRGISDMLPKVVDAYRAGKLNHYAEEIEKNYLPLLDNNADEQVVSSVFIVNPNGEATIYKLENDDWHKLPNIIGAKRLAPVRVDALDMIGKNVGFSDHLVAWIDIDAPRKGLPENKLASAFYPGVIAGDIVFSLADNLYDPMPFYGIDEAECAIQALGATINEVVTDTEAFSDEKAAPADYSKVNPFVDKGYMARIEPDGKAYIVESSLAVFALFEEDIYDPARLNSLYDLSKKMGIKGRITIWMDNSACRKEMVLYNKINPNAVGAKFYPGPVADNIFLALEDENFRMSIFNDRELLKKVCLAVGATQVECL